MWTLQIYPGDHNYSYPRTHLPWFYVKNQYVQLLHLKTWNIQARNLVSWCPNFHKERPYGIGIRMYSSFTIWLVQIYVIIRETIIRWDVYGLFNLASIIRSRVVYVDAGSGTYKKSPFNCPLVNHPYGISVSKKFPHQDSIQPSSSFDFSKYLNCKGVTFNGLMPLTTPPKPFTPERPPIHTSIILVPSIRTT